MYELWRYEPEYPSLSEMRDSVGRDSWVTMMMSKETHLMVVARSMTVQPDVEVQGRKIKESDRAYETVKQLIVSLQLAPGTVIEEAELRLRVGIGRTPLREALYRLVDHGLVVVAPRRGFFVADISAAGLQELSDLRLVLESMAVRLATERSSPSIVPQLRAVLLNTDLSIAAHDLNQLIEIDLSFHRLLAHAAGNQYLEETLDRLYAMMLRFWYLSFERAGQLPDVMHEHANIVNAIEHRDSLGAEAAMRFHVLEFRNKVQAILSQSPRVI